MFINRLKKNKLVFIGLLIFTYYSSFLLVTYHNDASKTKSSSIHKTLIYKDNDWVLNHNVLQYSSIAVELDDNQLQVESLFFFNNENDEEIQLNTTLRCLLSAEGIFKPLILESLIAIPLMNIDNTTRNLWKARCLTNNKDYSVDKIRVAIVDIDNYIFPTSLIKYQIPTYYNVSRRNKIPEIANCVHLVHDLSNEKKIERLFNWLNIQSAIGLKTVKLYFYEIENNVKSLIRQKYPLIKTIEYYTDLKHVCNFEIEAILYVL